MLATRASQVHMEQLLGGSEAVPFLLDVDVHVRFLLAMPLLIAAELVVHRRRRSVVSAFLERQLIPESEITRFRSAIASAMRLRYSVPAELLLIILVYRVGVLIIWRHCSVRGLWPAIGVCSAACPGEADRVARIWHAGRASRARVRRQMAARGAPADEPLVGSGDIQSLADLGKSYDVLRTMRSVPVTKEI